MSDTSRWDAPLPRLVEGQPCACTQVAMCLVHADAARLDDKRRNPKRGNRRARARDES